MPKEALIKTLDQDCLHETHARFVALQSTVGFYQTGDLLIVASPGVYHPCPGSSAVFTLQHLPDFNERKILVLGCGSGTLAIWLAKKNRVTAADIDREALRCTCFNALTNGVKLSLVESNVFAQLSGRRFEVIVFDLPYFDKEPAFKAETVGCDPGGAIAWRFLQGLEQHLESQGTAICTFSSQGDYERLTRAMEDLCLSHKIIAQERDAHTGVTRYLLAIKRSFR